MGDISDPRLREILAEAASVPSAERLAMLDAACAGDAELRRQVESLLAALDGGGDFLENPTLGLAENTSHAVRAFCEGPGSRIGPYKLLQQIGEGGMGIVFMAEQEMPIRRRVALKIIKPGLDSRQVIARFEAERQALAVMDHPNIAHVYDAGATESGRPYFVMELVRGTPITEYCDSHELTTRQRLELVVQVCQAVQHAHGKGIIHRDLKPSNVLVTIADGRPVPKVIDFGISKAIRGRLTEKTLFTEFRQLLGTPQYMSPEQADSNGVDVDTRSDVYSLGVLLYELLTGTTPLDGKELRSKAFAEMERSIRESDPPAPSTRVTTLGDAAHAIASRRKTELRKLGQLLRGELDWIVLRALEKDRARRYETANGLARDIERYLADEPVEACPPSATYRMRRFVRKHRFAMGIAAAFALVLVGATVVSLWQAVRATRARDAEARQRTLAQQAAAGEMEQRKQAEAVTDLIDTLFTGQNPSSDERQTFDPFKQLVTQVDRATESVEREHADEPLVRARLRVALAVAALGLREFSKAEPLLQTALQEQRAHLPPGDPAELTTLRTLGVLYLCNGRTSDAIRLFEQVHERTIEKRGADNLDSLRAAEFLAYAYHDDGQFDKMVALLEDARTRLARLRAPDHQAFRVQISLGDGYLHLGRLADKARLLEQLRDQLIAKLGPQHQDTLHTLSSLASTYGYLDRWDEQIAMREHIRDVQMTTRGPEDPRTVNAFQDLADAYGSTGRTREAIQMLEKVRDAQIKLFGADDGRTLTTLCCLAHQYYEDGKSGEALKLQEGVVEAEKKRIGPYPDGPERSLRLDSLNDLALSYLKVGRTNEAIKLLGQVCDAAPKARGHNHPGTITMRNNLADAYLKAGRTDDAIMLLEQVRDQRIKVLGPDHRHTLRTMFNLAVAYSRAGRKLETIELLKQVGDRDLKKFGLEHPDTLKTLMNLAFMYQSVNRTDDAIKVWEQIREPMLEKKLGYPSELGITRDKMARSFRIAGGRSADLVKLFEPVRGQLEQSIKQKTAALTTRPSDPALLRERGGLYGRLGQFREAADDFLQVIRVQPDVLGAWHEGVPLLLWLGDSDGYRQWRSKELRQFASTKRKADGSTAVKDLLLLPAAAEDLQLAAELVDRQLAADPNDAWAQSTKGMVEYRRGNFDRAIPWLVLAADGTRSYRDIECHLFLSMAYQRVGRESEARAAFAMAVSSMQADVPNLGEGMIGSETWNMAQDWVMCQVVRKEAEALIRVKGATTGAVASTQEGPEKNRSPLGKSKKADAYLERLTELGNADVPVVVLRARAALYAGVGRFEEALADWDRTIHLDPLDSTHREGAAALHLYLGHGPEYLAARKALLSGLDQTKGDHALKTCLLLPLGGEEEARGVMAIEYWNHPPAGSLEYFHFNRGLAEYRCGNYPEALRLLGMARDELTQSIAKGAPGERERRGWDEARTTSEFLSAMCERRLDHNEGSREALTRARDLLRSSIPPLSSGRQRVGGFDWLMVHIIAREAERTILANDPTTMPATQPAAAQPASVRPIGVMPNAVLKGDGKVSKPSASVTDDGSEVSHFVGSL